MVMMEGRGESGHDFAFLPDLLLLGFCLVLLMTRCPCHFAKLFYLALVLAAEPRVATVRSCGCLTKFFHAWYLCTSSRCQGPGVKSSSEIRERELRQRHRCLNQECEIDVVF